MYRHDVYFREMAALVEQRPRQDVERMLCGSSFVMFKPDAVVGRRIEPALDFLAAHGFRPTGFATVPVDARAHRELWRYQLNAAPLTIIRTVDLILESGPCLLVALRDDRRPHPAGVAAAVRLAELKGSSRNRAAGGASLRRALGCELLCLNFLHAPDDPSDLLRELGVLVPRQRRAAVLDLLLGEPSATCGEELTAAVAELYAAHPAHPLSTPPRTAASRLTGQQISARLAELAEAAEHADAATAAGHRARWDRIVEAARLVDGLGSEGAPLIGPPPGTRPDHRPPGGEATPPAPQAD
ncbi:hypothetical protein [Streptacidiphilus monticola]|uniref:Nucleoside diphosphate kinase-like domain-containing protein n=1 Tax=Streptacidiphilus monticola TaxID=2161674 RepID=A0ABW1FVJ0_9ACTN